MSAYDRNSILYQKITKDWFTLRNNLASPPQALLKIRQYTKRMVSTTISFLVTFSFSNSIGSEYLKEFRSSKEISDLSHQVLRQNIDVATPPHSCCAITSCKPVMYGKLQINYNSITSFIDAPTESFTALARCLVASH